MTKLFKSRYATLAAVFVIYLLLSFVVRTILLSSICEINVKNIPLIYIMGFLFDITVALAFISGDDVYFDNMNVFFGGQGFTLVNRNQGNTLPENTKNERTNIEDKDVTFENAWGICDEDIYNQSLKMANLVKIQFLKN